MKKINKILVIFFLVFFSNQSYSENHNQVSVELDRIKNDIIDLQKFVYKNESSLGDNSNSNAKNDLEELKILINDISKSIASLENQISDIKDDVSNLYSLYTSSDSNEKNIIGRSDQLNIEESYSNIVENKIFLQGIVLSLDGKKSIRHEVESFNREENLAQKLSKKFFDNDVSSLLNEIDNEIK